MRDSCARIWPHLRLEVSEGFDCHLLILKESQLLLVLGVLGIEDVRIVEGDLQEVEHNLLGPFEGPPGEGVVLQHLIKVIYSSHVFSVVPYCNWALQLGPFNVSAPLSSDPPQVLEGFGVDAA